MPGSTARSFADAACSAVEHATSEVGDTEELASAFAELQHSFKRAEGDEAHPWPHTRAQEKEPVEHEWDPDAIWREWHDLYSALSTGSDAPTLDELAADGDQSRARAERAGRSGGGERRGGGEFDAG